MKAKKLKIKETTLFVYKQTKGINSRGNTDTTTGFTTTTTLTGVFNK